MTTQQDKIPATLAHFNKGGTVVVIKDKDTVLYNVKHHTQDSLYNALYSAVVVRLI